MNQGTVITTVVITAGSSLLSLLVRGVPRGQDKSGTAGAYGKILVGAFGMGLMLTAIGAGSAQIATALGWVIALSAILINGDRVFTGATNSLKG